MYACNINGTDNVVSRTIQVNIHVHRKLYQRYSHFACVQLQVDLPRHQAT